MSDDSFALLGQHVEEEGRATGRAIVPSHDVGRAILEPLRDLDEVAYLRSASVYRVSIPWRTSKGKLPGYARARPVQLSSPAGRADR